MASRRNFSRATKRAIYERSGGVCECHRVPWLRRPMGCGARLGGGNVFYEHVNPDALGGLNDLANGAALSKTCWREKTSRYDQPAIARANRVRDRHINARATARHVIIGCKASGWKHRLNGGWVRRAPAGPAT